MAVAPPLMWTAVDQRFACLSLLEVFVFRFCGKTLNMHSKYLFFYFPMTLLLLKILWDIEVAGSKYSPPPPLHAFRCLPTSFGI